MEKHELYCGGHMIEDDVPVSEIIQTCCSCQVFVYRNGRCSCAKGTSGIRGSTGTRLGRRRSTQNSYKRSAMRGVEKYCWRLTKKTAPFVIKMRVPGWCKKYEVAENGKSVEKSSMESGYLKIERIWMAGDLITLNVKMPVEVVAADPRVKQNVGRRAIQCGPLVNCAEQADNKNRVK